MVSRHVVLLGLFGLLLLLDCRLDQSSHDCSMEGRVALYEQRIEPLFLEDRPKSCNQCHLSGIDLEMFLKATPCQTMACLDHRGLVDLKVPEQSLLLAWVDRADPASPLITAEVLAEEREAIHQWIDMTASCGHCGDFGDDPCGDEKPQSDDCASNSEDPVLSFSPSELHGCTDLALEKGFYEAFYVNRFRCFPCHFSDVSEIEEAPKWLQVGACEPASLATLREVEARGYVDTEHPMESLLLTKPLDEEQGGVEHGGGPKFNVGADPFYDALTVWLKRYAECRD